MTVGGICKDPDFWALAQGAMKSRTVLLRSETEFRGFVANAASVFSGELRAGNSIARRLRKPCTAAAEALRRGMEAPLNHAGEEAGPLGSLGLATLRLS